MVLFQASRTVYMSRYFMQLQPNRLTNFHEIWNKSTYIGFSILHMVQDGLYTTVVNYFWLYKQNGWFNQTPRLIIKKH